MSDANLRCRVATRLAAGVALMLAAEALAACPGDTNGDALVNVNDVLNVLANWGLGPFDPPGADTNSDGIVNVTDFLLVLAGWGPCAGSGPYLVGYSDDDCQPGGARAEEPCTVDDSFEFVVEGDRLTATHHDATYNCCPEDIEVSLAVDEWLLILTEEEILVNPCPCLCCYAVQSTVGGLAPGTYTVEYWWSDYETGQERCYTDDVVVWE
ncbi:MAG: hypothetical protein ACYSWT_00620 [Planctomycetota bacterium]|jgi:hypothetical protein